MMRDTTTAITWWPVLVAGLAYFMLGAPWFTGLFGSAYDAATGVTRSRNQKWPLIYYVGPLLTSMVVAVATAILVQALDIRTVPDALKLGLVVGLGYSASISFTNGITPNMKRPLLFGAVTGSYHLLGAILVSVILTVLR